MIRRYVNLVRENYKTGVYSLHRLDVSKHLFHPSRADPRVVVLPPLVPGEEERKQSCDELDMLKELPAPCVKIRPCFREERGKAEPFWASLSPHSSEDKSLCINWMGDAMLCDAGKPSVDPMPHFRDEVGLDTISVSIARQQDDQEEEEEDLYIIHPWRGNSRNRNNSRFRVLRREKDAAAGGQWRWESLPPPPFDGDPRYHPAPQFISSHTVVDGGRTICFSCGTTSDIGCTYCFDTVDREWRHAGDWILPFVGGAEHVPDLALWLGFSPCEPHHYLCATSDLNVGMSAMDRPPRSQYVWQDLVTQENWSAGRTQVLSLGAGRFCVAKNIVVMNRRTAKLYEYSDHDEEEESWQFLYEMVVLTGVEVGRDDDESIKVWKHKSMQCNSGVTGVL